MVPVVLIFFSYFLVILFIGQCNAGYFCVEGSDSPNQEICPTGHYCPVGTGSPERCPEVSVSHKLV